MAMTAKERYLAGWNASKRTRTYDLDAAESRHESRHGEDVHVMFPAGWCDYAADRPKFASLTCQGCESETGPVFGRDREGHAPDCQECPAHCQCDARRRAMFNGPDA